MNDAVAQDAAMYRLAYRDISTGLSNFVKQLEKPRSSTELIDMSAELKAMAERFESLTRGVLELQGRACV